MEKNKRCLLLHLFFAAVRSALMNFCRHQLWLDEDNQEN